MRRAISILALFATTKGIPMATGQIPDVATPLVSYQFLDSISDTPDQPNVVSPLVSYQYFEWLGDENLTFEDSPLVSYYFNGPPRILTQPSSQLVRMGSNVTLSVVADGTLPLTYEWRFNGQPLADSNGASIALDNVQTGDSGIYSVGVSNASGAVTSNGGRFIVYDAPAIPKPAPPGLLAATQVLSDAQRTKQQTPVSTQLRWFNAATSRFENLPQPLPGKMAIVLTHGWNSGTDDPNWPTKMARTLVPGSGANANILAWDWHEEAQGFSGWAGFDPAPVAARVVPQGSALGGALMDALGPAVDKNIHFIGHSFGTAVNCAAANYIHGDKRPRGEARPYSQKYSSFRTHLTLFDEAELATGFKGLHVILDIPQAAFDDFYVQDAVEQLNNFRVKVIPDHWGWIDNYISAVGFLHPEAVNVMLYRKNYVLNEQGYGQHGYSTEWYQETIAYPQESLVGHRWSFERNTLFQGPMAPGYYRQSLDVNGSEMIVTRIGVLEAEAASWGRLVAYPTLKAAQGIDAGGKYVQKQVDAAGNYVYEKASAISTKVGATYLDGIQYFGNLLADFTEKVTAPKGTPVMVGTNQSTAAYFLSPEQTAGDQQAGWSLNFSIQPGVPQPQQLNIPMRASSIESAADGPAYTFIPVHVPHEAVGISFEYKMEGTAVDDFMTMGIGTTNNFTMEAKYVEDGEWNGTPVMSVSDLRDQDVQLVFALIGSNGPPAGMLGIRNVEFYVPPKPQLEVVKTGDSLTASWPLSTIDWTIETTTDLNDPNGWEPVAEPPTDADFFHTMTFDVTGTNRAFFRLKK